MNSDIPRTVSRLFWDMDPTHLDTHTHEKSIIERVLNDGALSDWRWLISVYGSQTVKDALSGSTHFPLRHGIREQSVRLASLILK